MDAHRVHEGQVRCIRFYSFARPDQIIMCLCVLCPASIYSTLQSVCPSNLQSTKVHTAPVFSPSSSWFDLHATPRPHAFDSARVFAFAQARTANHQPYDEPAMHAIIRYATLRYARYAPRKMAINMVDRVPTQACQVSSSSKKGIPTQAKAMHGNVSASASASALHT